MSEQDFVDTEQYNKEDDFIRRVLLLMAEYVVPAKVEAQLRPSKDTVSEYSVALDSVVSMLELTERLSEKDIEELNRDFNKAMDDCIETDAGGEPERITPVPLRWFQRKLSRIIAAKKFFERTYDNDEEVKEALKDG